MSGLNLVKRNRILILIFDSVAILGAFLVPKIASWCLSTDLAECNFRMLGLLCPSCGGTHCTISFFTGDFPAAFSHNAYMAVTFILLAFALLLVNLKIWINKPAVISLCDKLVNYKWTIVWAIGYVVFGIARNVVLFI